MFRDLWLVFFFFKRMTTLTYSLYFSLPVKHRRGSDLGCRKKELAAGPEAKPESNF